MIDDDINGVGGTEMGQQISQGVLDLGGGTPNRSAVCPECKLTYEPCSGTTQRTCGAEACRTEFWRREDASRAGGRATKADRILARLRQGPADTMELARVGGIRFSARILELRQAGHQIKTVEHGDYATYTLEGRNKL